MRWVSTLGLLEGGGRVFPDWGRKGAKLTREVPPRSSSLFFITASHVSSFHQRTRRRTWTSEGRRKKGKDVHLVVWEGLDVHAWIDRRMTRIRSRRKKPRDTMPVHAPHVLTTTNRRTRRSSVLGANVKKDMRRLPRKGDPCPDTSQKGDQTNPRVEKKKKRPRQDQRSAVERNQIRIYATEGRSMQIHVSWGDGRWRRINNVDGRSKLTWWRWYAC